MTGVHPLNLLLGQNTTAALTKHAETLEGQLHHLHELASDSSSLMLDIINGKIPIVVQASGSGTSTAGVLT